MRLVFCADPLSPRAPDTAFQAEVDAAGQLGIPYDIVSYEALVDEQDAARSVARVPQHGTPETAIYRGWMLTPAQYTALYGALADRGVRLLNDPDAYTYCHYLPSSYAAIERHTPHSVWLHTRGDVSTEELARLLGPFGSAPVVVKDFVKSRKHEWAEACFIPSAADLEAAERVVRCFIELQGDDLNEGLVFREFVEFQPLTQHSLSGMPLSKEFRVFVLDGTPVFTAEYWEEGDYAGATPSVERFLDVARAIPSRFFTMDIAQRTDGEWMIVELGDGQVAGLPETADALAFMRALRDGWQAGGPPA